MADLLVEGVTRRYGDRVALDDVSLTVPAGEVFGLLGPNGAGKTTLMRIVMGLARPDAGRVTRDGRELSREDRMRFGYLPEERGLYAEMSVADHIVYLARLHGVDKADAQRRTADWVDRLGLGERSKDKVSHLSLGNQQRVQLAAALVHDPDVLILDEPFSGLDVSGVDLMTGVLDDAAARGVLVVFSSHQLDLVEGRCRSVAILDEGRVVAAGPVADLAATGRARVLLEVDAPDGWHGRLTGVEASVEAGRVRCVLADDTSPGSVLEQAQRLGAVRHFSIERRTLAEIFREATS